MSKERDSQLLKTLKEICEHTYFRPTDIDLKSLENTTLLSAHDISHSLNNLQRDGTIRIHMGLPGEPSKVELLKSSAPQ
jgi:hypothetical protein